jgi:hypothetical protein
MIPGWDEIAEEGWGAEFAAGVIFQSIRVNPNLELARWSWARLLELSRGELLPRIARERKVGRQITVGRANAVLVRLQEILTTEERRSLG